MSTPGNTAKLGATGNNIQTAQSNPSWLGANLQCISQLTNPLLSSMKQKSLRAECARTYIDQIMQQDIFSQFDEMSSTLDGPFRWAKGWVQNHQRVRRQQGDSSVLIWQESMNTR